MLTFLSLYTFNPSSLPVLHFLPLFFQTFYPFLRFFPFFNKLLPVLPAFVSCYPSCLLIVVSFHTSCPFIYCFLSVLLHFLSCYILILSCPLILQVFLSFLSYYTSCPSNLFKFSPSVLKFVCPSILPVLF